MLEVIVDSLYCARIRSKVGNILTRSVKSGCPEHVVKHIRIICTTVWSCQKVQTVESVA